MTDEDWPDGPGELITDWEGQCACELGYAVFHGPVPTDGESDQRLWWGWMRSGDLHRLLDMMEFMYEV